MKYNANELTALSTLSRFRLNLTLGTQTILLSSNGKVHVVIECQPCHLQPLKEMGVRFDFSDKRVGFAHNQKTTSGTANSIRISATMNIELLRRVNEFSRSDHSHGQLNLESNHHLKKMDFPFPAGKIKSTEIATLTLAARKSASILRQRLHGNRRKLTVNKYVWLRLEDRRYIAEVVYG